jgi:GT2 family glycosyltransferase
MLDVVIVNYHGGDSLLGSVDAAYSFAGEDVHVVIVDNSPSDGAVAGVLARHPEVTVVTNDVNRGFAAAVNQGLELCGAELVLLLNPDVHEIRGTVAELQRVFEGHERVGAVGVRLLNADGTLQRSARPEVGATDILVDVLGLRSRLPAGRRFWPEFYEGWEFDSEREVETVIGAFLVLSRSALDEVGVLDERYFVYAEETDWLVRARRRGFAVIFTPAIEAVHQHRKSTDTGSDVMELLLLRSYYLYAHKHLGVLRTGVLRSGLLAIDSVRLGLATARGAGKQELRALLEKRVRVHLGLRVAELDELSASTRPGRTTQDRQLPSS